VIPCVNNIATKRSIKCRRTRDRNCRLRVACAQTATTKDAGPAKDKPAAHEGPSERARERVTASEGKGIQQSMTEMRARELVLLSSRLRVSLLFLLLLIYKCVSRLKSECSFVFGESHGDVRGVKTALQPHNPEIGILASVSPRNDLLSGCTTFPRCISGKNCVRISRCDRFNHSVPRFPTCRVRTGSDRITLAKYYARRHEGARIVAGKEKSNAQTCLSP